MPPQTSGLAIASLIFGILSLIIGWIPVFGWLIFVLAIVLGFIALRKIKQDKSLTGSGLAIAGIVLGFISFVIFILFFGLIFAGSIFGSEIGKFGKAASECPGRCYKLNPPANAPAGIYANAKCDLEFETKLSGATIPKNAPKIGDPTPWRCDECCIQTGEDKRATEEPKTEVHRMNEPVQVDYLIYTITKAESFTEMGNEFMNKRTDGIFIKIYLKIANNAKETKDLFTPRFKLIDKKGRSFDRLSDDILYVADGLEFGKQLQPGLSTSGAIVFELPKDFEGLGLVISGDWMSTTEKLVLIDTLQNIGTDTTLKQRDEQVLSQIYNN